VGGADLLIKKKDGGRGSAGDDNFPRNGRVRRAPKKTEGKADVAMTEGGKRGEKI